MRASTTSQHLTGRRRAAIVVAVAMLVGLLGNSPSGAKPRQRDTVVLRWNNVLLSAVRAGTLGPPMVSRALAIAHTCMFDAWAAYDDKAVGTRLGATLRRPKNERSRKNREEAISFGAYRAAVDLYPAAKPTFDGLMSALRHDPANTTTDTTTPAGIGNVACKAVLDYRHGDGANQLGDTPGGAPGVAYSDYTGYVQVNAPMDLRAPFDPATVVDPNRWQPLRYVAASGAVVTPAWLAHQWSLVTPFALASGDQFRSAIPPATYGTDAYERQAREVLRLSATLDDRKKTISEYWADGPASETPPGHWNVLAQFVSRRDDHNLNQDVKLFFALNNAIFDAGVCAWDNKEAFDSVRPITAIRYLFNGQTVRAWGGPNQGRQTIDGGSWLPYQKATFPTPPFGEFASGHSTFSAAAAEILKRFTGDDRFGMKVVLAAGSSQIEPGVTPAKRVGLAWKTFTQAANEAGLSRRFGGIHFKDGDLAARAAGRDVAAVVWGRAKAYFGGTA